MENLPDGSLYFWMYQQGLKGVAYQDIIDVCRTQSREIRPKDEQNYFNGRYKHDLYLSTRDIFAAPIKRNQHGPMRYEDYPLHPYMDMPEVEQRWVPCNAEGKPLYKWSNGCLSYMDAMSMKYCKSLAENMKGTKAIVIDCDGDHGSQLDLDTIKFLSKYINRTHCLAKPKLVNEYIDYTHGLGNLPASFHLTFTVDRVIPTMHFAESHIDVIGNKANSLRYLKNKVWNQIDPIPMTPEIWDDIMNYIKEREHDE